LFISTERYKFCILAYDSSTGEIITRANGDIMDKTGRPADIGQIGIIDPGCRVIGLHMYDGLFKVIPIDPNGQLKEAFNIRMEELQVLDIQFLHKTAKPTICLLYQDPKEQRHIKTYEILIREKEFGEGPFSLPNVEGGASIIIPVPTGTNQVHSLSSNVLTPGGILIIGEQTITYHNGRYNQALTSISMRPTIIKSFGRVDVDGSRYLLGDHVGLLSILVLERDNTGKVVNMKLEELGEVTKVSLHPNSNCF
jgi:DNA damage-binding protein 1